MIVYVAAFERHNMYTQLQLQYSTGEWIGKGLFCGQKYKLELG